MGIKNVACPYCGDETWATMPDDAELKQVTKEKKKAGSFRTMATFGLSSKKDPQNYVEAGCDDHDFYVYYE